MYFISLKFRETIKYILESIEVCYIHKKLCLYIFHQILINDRWRFCPPSYFLTNDDISLWETTENISV